MFDQNLYGHIIPLCKNGRSWLVWFIWFLWCVSLISLIWSEEQEKPDKPNEPNKRDPISRVEIETMHQGTEPSPYPQKICCKKYRRGLAKSNLLLAHNRLCVRGDWFLALDFQRSRP